MLVDINAYTGHWPFRQMKHNTCESRLQLMKQFDVDISVVSSLSGAFYKNTQSANEELYQDIKSNRRFSNHFIPMAVINPIYGGWKNDFKESVEKFGMKGIRIYPRYHLYDYNDKRCVELVKMARDRGLPVAVDFRMVDRRVSSWMDINEESQLSHIMPLISAVPDASYLLLNVANSTSLPAPELAVFRKSRFIMDTSGRALTNLGQMIKDFSAENFAFGTHSPIFDYRTGLLRIEALRADEASESVKEQMRSGNAKKLFNI